MLHDMRSNRSVPFCYPSETETVTNKRGALGSRDRQDEPPNDTDPGRHSTDPRNLARPSASYMTTSPHYTFSICTSRHVHSPSFSINR
ncbi:hypothetical protein J6590_039273 [Homalodisca vitripennis]|nr:hypothetical protein J6590_039273 [Homalodisca vitripennis]